jgi:hypothetical protein
MQDRPKYIIKKNRNYASILSIGVIEDDDSLTGMKHMAIFVRQIEHTPTPTPTPTPNPAP